MNPKEIQELKDKAAREAGYDDWNGVFIIRNLDDNEEDVINRAIELASKREVKVPDEDESTTERTRRYGTDFRSMGARIGFKDGANWAIERIKELNQ